MSVTYTGEQQATEGSGSKFAGVRSDAGGSASEFVAIAAGTRETVNGKVQAPMRTQIDTGAGGGATLGVTSEAVATTDTGNFSLIALTKRLAQHFTTSIGWLEALGASDDAAVITDDDGTINAHTRGLVAIQGTMLDDTENIKLGVGATNETAPASDTATAGLNGRLQRVAQRITSMIALLPASLGQKTSANSLAVTIASDQGVLAVTPSGATPAYGTVSVTTSATVIRAASATRKSLRVRNSSASAGAIWLGYSNSVTAGTSGTNFEVLYPGDSILITDYRGDVYGICDSGLSASAKYAEVTT